jgi:hypothetical protein
MEVTFIIARPTKTRLKKERLGIAQVEFDKFHRDKRGVDDGTVVC